MSQYGQSGGFGPQDPKWSTFGVLLGHIWVPSAVLLETGLWRLGVGSEGL